MTSPATTGSPPKSCHTRASFVAPVQCPASLPAGWQMRTAWLGWLLLVVTTQSVRSEVDQQGTAHLPAMQVPFSAFASPEARQPFISHTNAARAAPPATAGIGEQRPFYDRYNIVFANRAKALYP